jgi:2,4-dienoyl-CoA reductase-like NADH-dependent reductase (Old Yellow Enzyme family)
MGPFSCARTLTIIRVSSRMAIGDETENVVDPQDGAPAARQSLVEHRAALFQPLQIRGVTIRNRIAMAPMTRERSPNGVPGDDVAAYYRRRAEYDTGLLITEGVGIDHPAAVDRQAIPLLHGGEAQRAWRRIVDDVHAVGGKIIAQLWHQGVHRDPRISARPEVPGMRPSGIWGPDGGAVSLPRAIVEYQLVPTRAMSETEIGDVISAYGRSAAYAAAAGFDGVELHGAHGYLIDNFLWKETNKRTDRWGGASRTRSLFAVEVAKTVRRAIGINRMLFFRFSQFKMQDFRAQLAKNPTELSHVLEPIAEAGVDVFDASHRDFDRPAFPDSPLSLAGWARHLTGRMSMAVGGIGVDGAFRPSKKADESAASAVDNLDAVLARFSQGEFDMIAVGRALLNDPQWTRRVRLGLVPLSFDNAAFERLY